MYAVKLKRVKRRSETHGRRGRRKGGAKDFIYEKIVMWKKKKVSVEIRRCDIMQCNRSLMVCKFIGIIYKYTTLLYAYIKFVRTNVLFLIKNYTRLYQITDSRSHHLIYYRFWTTISINFGYQLTIFRKHHTAGNMIHINSIPFKVQNNGIVNNCMLKTLQWLSI